LRVTCHIAGRRGSIIGGGCEAQCGGGGGGGGGGGDDDDDNDDDGDDNDDDDDDDDSAHLCSRLHERVCVQALLPVAMR